MLAARDGRMAMAGGRRDNDLDRGLSDLLGQEVRLGTMVSGGSIHRAQELLLTGGDRLFLKSCAAERQPLLEAERQGLAALAAASDPAQPLRIPAVQACGRLGDRAVLVLEWLPLQRGGSGGDREQAWRGFGAALAQLHRRSAEARSSAAGTGAFGWAEDNWIGSAPQRNRWCRDWATFFVEHRLEPQLTWAARLGHPFRGADALLKSAGAWLRDHQPAPSLVHGDLWAGNGGLLVDGGGAIFDPASHWADREVDLAMAALFGGFPPAFFAGYEATWPRPSGHRQRQALYNLYHELNHANLFGGGYRNQAQATIDALLSRWS